ncbi:MAG: iron-containing alcohol dehydrogenase, partial [Lachnospiraceae bacterium]|nr:iron-containing alcohol dehydrogenase [Lachnospiraceae bacterium]
MFSFNYYTPTEIRFGKGTADQAGEYVKKYHGTRVLIHYGGGSVVRTGLLERVKASLDQAGITHVELGGVVPNPRLSKVYEGIRLCREEKVDFLLAVGGGSVIDSAKAIGYGLTSDRDVWDLFEHTRTAQSCMPLGCILTIAAAGSEMSNSCVITNEANGKKRAYNNDIARPRFAILDPELTMTLPDYQT